jgi:hypothetical protein
VALDVGSVVAKLVADTKQFDKPMQQSVQVIQRLNKAGEVSQTWVKVMANEMEKASGKTDGFRLAMTRLSRDIKVAGTIFNALEGSIKQAYEAASEGAKIMAAEQFFKNAGKSIEEYRKATNGMVSDAELMKKANLADSMGIDEATFKKLVMVAEASALKTGQSFDYMFNSIIVGTARSSRLLLDNLGIIVSVGQANETYAAKVNKTVEALSAEEKQLAFVEEVARKSQGTLDEYAKTTDRTAEAFARFDATVTNLVDSVKRLLAVGFSKILPDVTRAFSDLRVLIEQEDWAATGRYIGARILQGISGVFSTVDPTGFFDKAGTAFGAQANLTAFKGRTANDSERNFYVEQVVSTQKKLEAMTTETVDSLIMRFKALGSVGNKALDIEVGYLLKVNELADDFLGILKKVKKPADDAAPPTVGRGGRSRKGGEESETPDAGEMLAEALARQRELDQAGRVTMDPTGYGYDHLFASRIFSPFENATAKFGRSVEEYDLYQKDWFKRLDERIKEIVEFNRPIGTATQQVATGQGLFGPIVNAIGDMSGGFTKLITGSLGSLTGPLGAAAGPLGAVLGALIPVVLSLIDSLKPVQILMGALTNGLAKLIENALGELLNALVLLANPIGDLLAAIGLLIGSALRPLVTILTAVVWAAAMVVEGLAWLVVALGPFVETLSWFVSLIITSGLSLISLFIPMGDAAAYLSTTLTEVANNMLRTAIWFNNGFVSIMRGLGLKGFGRMLSMSDFRSDDPLNENTSAIEANTQAVRDLIREFRNLPQGYKAEGAIYASQDAEARWRRMPTDQGIGRMRVPGFTNGRWRT